MNKEFYLEEEVKEFLKKKIKDVKTVDDIIPNFKFKISEPQNTDYEDLYKQLWRFKKALQLTLNVYNYHAAYSEYQVKFGPEDIKLHFYHGDTDDMPKVCANRPKDRDVVEALYNYIYCFLSIQWKDSNPATTKEEYVPVTKCSFCDQDLVEGEQICPTCRADIQDMRQMGVATTGSTKMASEEIGRSIRADMEGKHTVRDTDETHVRQRTVSKETEIDIGPKWTCWKCGLKNDYDCLSCGACYANYEDGRWMCAGCNQENGGDSKVCKLCGKNNVHAVKQNGLGLQNISEGRPPVDNERRPDTYNTRGDSMSKVEIESQIRKVDDDWQNVEKEIKKFEEKEWHTRQRGTSKDTVIDTRPTWTCGKCELRNDYDCLTCDACYAKYEEGRWMCADCNLENGGDRKICWHCYKENEFVVKAIGAGVPNVWEKRPGVDYPYNDGYDKGLPSGIGASDDQDWGDRWRCGECRLLQTFEVDKCSVCYYRRSFIGSWKCDQCASISKCDRTKCDKCNKVNERLVVLCEECKEKEVEYGGHKCYDCDRKYTNKLKDYNEKNYATASSGLGVSDDQDWGDQWRCVRCRLLQTFEFDKCYLCDYSRSLFGSWKCDQCTSINECYRTKCDKCYKVNERLVVLCEECKEKEVEYGGHKCYNCKRKWTCKLKYCNERNGGSDLYCNKCRLDPCGNNQKLPDGSVKRVWICITCQTINRYSYMSCQICESCNSKKW